MVKALFDTNILIDCLNGVDAAVQEIERYEDRAISIVTWVEVMAGASADKEQSTRAFLKAFKTVALDDQIAESAAAIRRHHRMKLPDAIIWASARTNARLLVTRDVKDFPVGDPGIREPYRI